jgi:transglycosylase-like protein with SLT domain
MRKRLHKAVSLVGALTAGLIINAACAEPASPERPAKAPLAENQQTQEPSSDSSASQSGSQEKPSETTRSSSECAGLFKCGVVDAAAARHGVPPEFFRRLIQQESDFDPKAVSHAGALGIAQFMPGTARWRGLADPFEPTEALDASARWLAELAGQFGNLGLAAAAYNAGPQRVKDWIAGHSRLPNETRSYVRLVTGRFVEEWLHPSSREDRALDPSLGPATPAPRISRRLQNTRDAESRGSAWGVQLMGDVSESRALSEYAQLQRRFHSLLSDRAPTLVKRPMGGRGPSTWFFVRVAEATRENAVQLCTKLKSAGGSCLVMPN